MFDFYGGIVGDLRKFAMQGFDDGNGVTHGVEKIGVAKGDVLRARADLLTDIRKYNFRFDQAKCAVVDGNNGTVTAMMLAAAAGFGVADGAMLAVGKNEMRVGFQGRQAVAIGNLETQ